MAFSALSLAAPAVRTLAPYVPGKPLEELEREYGISNSIKLASNENPLGPGELARAAARKVVDELGLYPDSNGYTLKKALARKHGCSLEAITLGNGSNDVLVMLAEAFLTPETEAVYSQYSFAIYAIASHAVGAREIAVPALGNESPMALGHDLDTMRAAVTPKTRVVFVANPNNPTGTWADKDSLERFVKSIPETTLVVIDEAYIEYVRETRFPDASRWLDRYPNLVVTRTFSKAYGLAGLRVGYALSHPEVGALLGRVRQPFNVNSISLAAAAAALDDAAHLKRSVELVHAGLEHVGAGLDRLRVRRYPTVGNFVLIDCERPAGAIYEAMLRQGVIVRPVGNYSLPNHLRITIGTAEENQRMLAALQLALGR
jgi:histidinol-phosphate aminotransferase